MSGRSSSPGRIYIFILRGIDKNQGFSRVMTRPAGRVTCCSKCHGSGRVESGRVKRFSNLVGRVRSGQEYFKSHGSGRVGSRGDEKLTREISGRASMTRELFSPAGGTRAFGSQIRHVNPFPISCPKAFLLPKLNNTILISYSHIKPPPNSYTHAMPASIHTHYSQVIHRCGALRV